MNVIIVVVDALRASDVGCYGREAETTPNIDALATDSMLFENAFSLSNYTDVCMSSILSGLAPREHGVTHHGTAHTEANLERIRDRSPKFLPELLQENGYTTIGVDWMGRWHSWGYDDYGVDTSEQAGSGLLPDNLFERLMWTASDLPEPILRPLVRQYYRLFGYSDVRVNCEDLTDIAIERIEDADGPFFELVHYWDVHPPYLPPDEYAERFSYQEADEPLSRYFGSDAKGPLAAEYPPYATGEHETVGDSKRAYDGAIAWVDEQLGRLFGHLERRDLLDETMVVVTADHGHNFGEHGIFSDNAGLYDTSIHVPLIVHDPRKEGRREAGIVQHTDIVPTVLDYAGIDRPESLRGNVLPETRDYAFAETIEHRMQMIRTDEWKLIRPQDVEYLRKQYWYTADGETELYELETDPGEMQNVAGEHPNVVNRLTELLERELGEQEATAGGTGRAADIDERELDDIKSRLGALGYADDDNV